MKSYSILSLHRFCFNDNELSISQFIIKGAKMTKKRTTLNFTSSTRIESHNFLKLRYLNREYTLEEFIDDFPNIHENYTLLENSTIIYRGKETKYSNFWDEMISIYNNLEDSQIYIDEILSFENNIIIDDFDLYRAGRFVYKAEKCIETACYYLMLSAQYFPTQFNHNWKNGYYSYFFGRSNNLLTSIMWYNNCFDYLLQVVFLSQKLYLKQSKLGPKSKIENIIKMCTLPRVMNALKEDENDTKCQTLIAILEEISVSHNEVRELANTVKHRGGLSVNGLEPRRMYKIDLLDENGEVLHSSRELEEVKALNIDIDEVLTLLYDEHRMLIKAIRDVVDVIYEFPSAKN